MNDANDIKIYKGFKKGDSVVATAEIINPSGFHMKKGTEGKVVRFEEVYKRFSSRHKPEVYGKTEPIKDRYLIVVSYTMKGRSMEMHDTVFALRTEIRHKKK